MERLKAVAAIYAVLYVFLLILNFSTSLQTVVVTGEMPLSWIVGLIGAMATVVYVPFVAIPTAAMFFYLQPVQNVVNRSKRGTSLPEDLYAKARRRLLRYPRALMLTLLLTLFAGTVVIYVGIFQDISLMFTFEGMVRFANNLALGAIVAMVNVSISNRIFLRAREIFKIHSVPANRRERDLSLRNRSMLLVVFLLANAMLGMYVSFQEVYLKETIITDTLRSVVDGEQTMEEAVSSTEGEFDSSVTPFVVEVFLNSEGIERAHRLRWMMVILWGAFGVLTLFVQWVFSQDFVNQIAVISRKIRVLVDSRADLDERLNISMLDEVGVMASNINDLLVKLSGLLNQIRAASDQVSGASSSIDDSVRETEQSLADFNAGISSINSKVVEHSQILKENQNLLQELLESQTEMAQEIEKEWDQLNLTATAIEEMIRQAKDISGKVDDIIQSEEILIDNAQEAAGAVSGSVAAISRIQETSKEVANMVGVISDIADQTNLLALNASIEAAHAGSAGRGFSVVAEEIRKLAATSSKSAVSILELVEQMTMAITSGVETANDTKGSLEAMLNNVHTTRESIHTVKNFVDAQQSGTTTLERYTQLTLSEMDRIKRRAQSEQEKNKSIAGSIRQFVETTSTISESLAVQQEGTASLKSITSQVRGAVENNRATVGSLNRLVRMFGEQDEFRDGSTRLRNGEPSSAAQ
jgi:methyl-accepting chemotaxis protein